VGLGGAAERCTSAVNKHISHLILSSFEWA
jgi:hypothetical protein